MKNFSEKVCDFPGCTNVYIPTQATSRYCGELHKRQCPSCGKVEVTARSLKEFKPCRNCRLQKAREKRSATLREKYGVDHISQVEAIKEKKREKALKNYGVENVSQAQEIKERKVATTREHYGVDNPSQAPEVKEKKEQSTLQSIGYPNPLGDIDLREAGMLKKYGVAHSMLVPEFKERAIATLSKTLESGAPHQRISKLNRTWAEQLQEHFAMGVTFEPKLLHGAGDLKIGDLILELNPTVSHNTLINLHCRMEGCPIPCQKHTPFPRDRHFKRAMDAREGDYSYLQFYSWDTPETIFKLLEGRLLPDFRHFSARKLSLVTLSSKEATTFLNKSHSQGGVRGQKYAYGLATGDELLAVATFGRGRFGSPYPWEWLRYAVKEKVIIHGGSGRLWKEFQKNVTPEAVVSYVDFNHTTKALTFLNSCGFQELPPTGPALSWSKGTKRIYDNSLRAQGADRLLGTTYGPQADSGLSNHEIMYKEGWLPVYTAGNRVYLWKP